MQRMRYANQSTHSDDTVAYLSMGRIGMLAAVVAVGTIFIPRGTPVTWGYVIFGLAFMLAVAGWVAIKLIRARQTERPSIPARTTLLVLCVLFIGAAAGGAGAGGKAAIYQPVILLVAVFLSCIGDLQMQVVGWCVAMAGVAWSSWSDGLRGNTYWVLLIIAGAIFLGVQGMVTSAVMALTAGTRRRVAVKQVFDALGESNTPEDALRACIGDIARVLPSDHIAGFYRGSDEERFSVVKSWPNNQAGDQDIADTIAFSTSLDSQRVVIDNSYYFIPGGQTPAGALMLVVDRSRTKFRSLKFVKEMCESIETNLVKLHAATWNNSRPKSETQSDLLNHLPNRWDLEDRVKSELVRSSQVGKSIALAMIEIDTFNQYDDVFGHRTGDRMLWHVASNLSDMARPQDFLARFNAEQFCIVMPDLEIANARRHMEILRKNTSGLPTLPKVTLSVGIASWNGSETPEAFLQRADDALHSAKVAGRDRVVMAP